MVFSGTQDKCKAYGKTVHFIDLSSPQIAFCTTNLASDAATAKAHFQYAHFLDICKPMACSIDFLYIV
jgi:hypothetical protein